MLARDNIHCLDACIVFRLCLPKPRGSFAWFERIFEIYNDCRSRVVFSVSCSIMQNIFRPNALSQFVLFQYFWISTPPGIYFATSDFFRKIANFHIHSASAVTKQTKTRSELEMQSHTVMMTLTSHDRLLDCCFGIFPCKNSWGMVNEQHQKLFHQLCIKLWIFFSLIVFLYGRTAPCTGIVQQSAFSACFCDKSFAILKLLEFWLLCI